MFMSILHIKLLGGFSVTLDDSPVAGLHQPRLQSLLAYLLLNRHAPQFETVLSVPVLARFDWKAVPQQPAQAELRLTPFPTPSRTLSRYHNGNPYLADGFTLWVGHQPIRSVEQGSFIWRVGDGVSIGFIEIKLDLSICDFNPGYPQADLNAPKLRIHYT